MNIKKIEKIVTAYGASVKSKAPVTAEGNLNVNKLQELPETKQVIEDLKSCGVKTRSELAKLGFVPASMILVF